MEHITYYAVAALPDGRLGQLLVTRGAGVRKQEWTGVVYATMAAARADLAARNCGGGR